MAALSQGFSRLGPRPLNVLAYHRILPTWDEQYPGDLELVSASLEDFRWQMKFVKKHFDPITLDELLKAVGDESRLPERPVMITFDDGFQDNFRYALPVLKEFDLSAVFFVSTGLIGGSTPFWFNWICSALLATSATDISSRILGEPVPIPQDQDGRRSLAGEILKTLKRIPNDGRLKAIEQLTEELNVPIQVEDSDDMPMTWAQLTEIVKAGSYVESHAHDHAILSMMSPEEIRSEIETSKAEIERNLNRPCRAISYPVGGPGAINEHVLHSVREAGLKVGFTYVSGTNKRNISEPLMLRRTHVERYIDRAEFATRMLMQHRIFVQQ